MSEHIQISLIKKTEEFLVHNLAVLEIKIPFVDHEGN